MPFSGGLFSKIYEWTTEQLSSPIEISKLDAQESDFATGLSNCILRDGTGLPTAAQDWNAQNLTNIGNLGVNGTLTTDNTSADEPGFKGMPQNSQSGNYTLLLTDAGKEVYYPSGHGSGDTLTIPANASVAFPVGTVIAITNDDGTNTVSIAITSDTLKLAGTALTGTRTLIANGTCVISKKTSTVWHIKGDVT